jgi:ubiquinone/menaquinone biosynthesis C-methylase UbiE
MKTFHFVEDYERHVDKLISEYPLDQAMALAVGGDFDRVGNVETDVLLYGGLHPGQALLDMGCGAGRLAAALDRRGAEVKYTGIDIVERLLEYARTKAPNARFINHQSLSIPLANESQDMVCAFSLFTHLLHHETYVYLQEIHRVLKPGGTLVFTFIELAREDHWFIFADTVSQARRGQTNHLNQFIERSQVKCWADRLGFIISDFADDSAIRSSSGPIMQTVAILRKV